MLYLFLPPAFFVVHPPFLKSSKNLTACLDSSQK
nr:MAG TPA: hypothetical protein [Caudoviricetes sp.]